MHTPVPTSSSISTESIEITRLNDKGDFDFFRAWSFDNTKIAFASDSEGKIYVMDVDGTNKIFLTSGGDPSWSPDSTQIAFASKQDGDYEIYVINTTGTNLTALTNNDISDNSPAWSPDGKKIAFVSDRDSLHFPDGATTSEIYIMNADGTEQTRLSNTATDWYESGSVSPDWSPDSKYIIFTTFMGFGNYDIHRIKTDGTEQKRLTITDTTWDLNPKWLPDGQHIVFQSSSISGGAWETYVMNADGSAIRPLPSSSSK
jgi:TolB protein